LIKYGLLQPAQQNIKKMEIKILSNKKMNGKTKEWYTNFGNEFLNVVVG
jgi:hypothetical protein